MEDVAEVFLSGLLILLLSPLPLFTFPSVFDWLNSAPPLGPPLQRKEKHTTWRGGENIRERERERLSE